MWWSLLGCASGPPEITVSVKLEELPDIGGIDLSVDAVTTRQIDSNWTDPWESIPNITEHVTLTTQQPVKTIAWGAIEPGEYEHVFIELNEVNATTSDSLKIENIVEAIAASFEFESRSVNVEISLLLWEVETGDYQLFAIDSTVN